MQWNMILSENDRFRAFILSAPTIAENLDIDSHFLKRARAERCKIVRFWRGGTPPTVVISHGEKVEIAVNEEACRRFGVNIFRRMSGGGAVLQSDDVLNYSLITPDSGLMDIHRAFGMGMDLVKGILHELGVEGVSQGISDVAVQNRKISGNSQARKGGGMLVHGTILIDFDYDMAEQVLPHPPREPEYRGRRKHRDFLVTLKELHAPIDPEHLESACRRATESVFDAIWLNGDDLSFLSDGSFVLNGIRHL
jgi:lipoate-protein ligase A